MYKEILKKLKQNHLLMIIICCAAPLIILLIAINIFNLNDSYLLWGILLVCPIMHYFMMKDMHKKHMSKGDKVMEKSNKNREN